MSTRRPQIPACSAGATLLVVALATALPWSAGARPPARPSTVLYPRGVRQIRFAHGAHATLPCARCHAGVRRSSSASDRHLPREAACRGCHGSQTRSDDGARQRLAWDKRCAFCHLGKRPDALPARFDAPQARLRFSHRLHAERDVSCVACHRGAGGSPAVEPTLPTMATCLDCHREHKATERCVACHLSQKDGRLRTRFGAARLRPSGSLLGDAHTAVFSRRHAQVARANKSYCESCHTPQQCLTCHAGSLRPMSIHRSDYLSHHALDARLDQPRCSSCHRSQTFCLSCHQRLGVSRSSNRGGFRPSTGVQFHPPGFNALSVGPGHHAFAARRNINTCVSCHQEKSCITCHGGRVLGGGGFSPHGPGFGASLKCRTLAARNRRACLKCHRPTERAISCQ